MNKNIKKTQKGIVTSDKTDKTITVLVNRVKEHPIYKKKYTVSKKYKVHDPENKYKTGEEAEFVSTKPISRDKKFIVVNKGI